MRIPFKIDQSIAQFDMLSEKDLNAMFRVIYGIIGKDFSEYKEEQ